MKLTPIDTATDERELVGLDVQGDAKTGLVVASLVGEDDQWSLTDPGDLVDVLTSKRLRGQYCYSHRLTYDLGILIPWLPDETDLLFIGEKLFKGKIRNGARSRTYFGDSSILWGGLSLSRLAREIGLPRLPAPVGLRCLEADHSYQYGSGDAEGDGLVEFSIREAEIVRGGMSLLQSELQALGGQLRDTLGATAVDLFRRKYLDAEYYTPFLWRNDFARRAYYGGRCEPLCLGVWEDVKVYDFHSHYPAQMFGHPYPDPNYLIGPREPSKLEWVMDREGCSDCTVDVPYSKYPPLPYKLRGQTYFPVGVFRGTWCHNELRYAIQCGVRIREVHATLYSERSCSPFDGYVSDLWQRRCELKAQGSPRATVYKLLLNNLAGKWGQREEGGLRELMTMDEYWQRGSKRGTEIMEIRRIAYAKVPRDTRWLPPYIIVPWAAYITAYGRIALHRLLASTNALILYCDTDSMITYADLPTGDRLGDLELQAKGATVDLIAPKMYTLTFADGTEQPIAKGVPLESQLEYCTYREVEYWRALNWQEAVIRKLSPSEWTKVKRVLQLQAPKRKYKPTAEPKPTRWLSEPLLVNFLAGHYQNFR